MCKSLLRIKCTNFEPKKVKIQEFDAFRIFCNKCFIGIPFIAYVVALRISYCSSIYIGYGE